MAQPTEPLYILATEELGADGYTNKEKPDGTVSSVGFSKQSLSYQAMNYLNNNQADWIRWIKEEQIPDEVSGLQDQITINKVPTGVPLPWSTDIAPSGYAIMKGQAFDTVLYPELFAAYPTGIIPDMRDLAIVGKGDAEVVLSYEEDAVKLHSHGASLSDTDLGTKTTSSYTHNHSVPEVPYDGAPINNSIDISSGTSSGGLGTTTTTDDIHSHTVALGSHGHTLIIGSTGTAENTIKNRKFNFIVRLA